MPQEVEITPPQPPPPPPPQSVAEVEQEESSGATSSDVTFMSEVAQGGSNESSDLAWKEMTEAWFNAIPAGWGPGSPVWDDVDPNSFLLQQNISFGSNLNPQNDQEKQNKQQEMFGSSSSFSPTSCPMRPFFSKDQD